MSLPFLQTIGLTKNEADLYELLLKLGEVPAGELIKQSALPRATAYTSLATLQKKGLVTSEDVAKKIHFRPEPPAKLLELAEGKYSSLDRARSELQSFLPSLTSSYILAVEKPVVSTYEGVEGLKQIYEDTLKEAKPIYAVVQVSEIEPSLHEWLKRTYVKKRAKLGIHAQVIVASGSWSKEFIKKDKEELRTTLQVSNTLYPFQHEVNIYGNKVAFIHNKKGEALIGIVINHPAIAQTMKAIFDLAWSGAQHSEQIKNSNPLG